MKQKLQQLAVWWAELPAWAKRIGLKFGAAGCLVGAAHLPLGPLRDVALELASELREDAYESRPAQPPPEQRDGGAS